MRDYKITLDIANPIIEVDELWFVKDDLGGFIEIELKDNDTLINLTGSNVLAVFEKKDKTVTQKEAIIIDSEKALIRLDMLNSIIDIPGKIKTEIKIYKGEQKVTFAPFPIIVKKSISMDDVVESYIELDIVQEVNKNTAAITKNIEYIKTLNSTIDANKQQVTINLNNVTKNIKSLQEGKANIIVSIEEPDLTTGLPLGTIWIRPIIENE